MWNDSNKKGDCMSCDYFRKRKASDQMSFRKTIHMLSTQTFCTLIIQELPRSQEKFLREQKEKKSNMGASKQRTVFSDQ